MIGYKHIENLGGGMTNIVNTKMASQRQDSSPSQNGTNELIANLDHELLDVRVRALKCLLRKLECGIVSSGSLKNRVDLLDRCTGWLSKIGEIRKAAEKENKNFRLESEEIEGVELVIQLLHVLAKHTEFRDLMRKENVDGLLAKLEPFIAGDFKCQLDAIVNSLVVGQYELSYEGAPTEWFDNTTCPSKKTSEEMFSSSSRVNPYSYKPYSDFSRSQDRRSTPADDTDSNSNTNTPESAFGKKSAIPLSSEENWAQSIQFYVPYLNISGTDRRIMNSTIDSLSSTSESIVQMTVCFIRDTLTMDFPSELFIQEPTLLLALAQVTTNRWSDRRIAYLGIQALFKISTCLRFRFTQLNSAEDYEVPPHNIDLFPMQKSNNKYYDYDYDVMSYSARMAQKRESSNVTTTDNAIENFIQLFKSFSRALQYTSSYDLHLWPVFDDFAFTLFKCVSIFPVDSKALTLSLQGVLMELAHIWERRSDFNTIVGLCLVSASILNAMKVHNETFIVSKDVRSMLRSLSCSPVIRTGWPELFRYYLQFASMFDTSSAAAPDARDSLDGENSENHPKRKILKLLYAIQNASSHEEVAESVDSLRDLLLPITLNIRLGDDCVSHILQDAPWRDTFYRFLCVEPTTEGDEDLLGHILDLFTYILQNSVNPSNFKWITPLCCEKSCTTLKLLADAGQKKEVKHGGTALNDILRSLLDFYSAILKHDLVLLSKDLKWELFQVYVAILHSLEEGSYANLALLTRLIKEFAYISQDEVIQNRIKENPALAITLIYRLTDTVMILNSSGGLSEGFKNSCTLHYLNISLIHMLIRLLRDENYKNFKGDWLDRCARAFQISVTSPDPRVKCHAFQICELLTSSHPTKVLFAEASFRDSLISLLDTAYGTVVEQRHANIIKFRAGNVVLNVLQDKDEKTRFVLAKKLQQNFEVMVNMSRLCARVLWDLNLSVMAKKLKAAGNKTEVPNGSSDGVPFITPRVLTVLCKILMLYLQSLETNDRENILHQVTSSGISQILFRIILHHPLNSEIDSRAWTICCCSLSAVIETLISLTKLDRAISIILIGEKRCLAMMFKLLDVGMPSSVKGKVQEKAEEALNALCGNVLSLATIMCCDAGNNFEDLERVTWAHQEVLFTKLQDWLKVSVPVVSRKPALGFCHAFLSVLSYRSSSGKPDSTGQPTAHPFLCRNRNDSITYGQALCDSIFHILKQSVDFGERISAMKSLSALFCLSASAVKHAVEEIHIVHYCVQKLHGYGCKFFDSKVSSVSGKKNTTVIQTEMLTYLELLSCIFYVSGKAKSDALQHNFPDIVHKIFAWRTSVPDLSLLHAFLETLLNFTEEFPEGALALTMTSNIVGVGPRRVPTQQSLFMEILGILEKEMSSAETNSNLKTPELIFELLKNICFVHECRNIFLKSPVVSFIRKLHSQETKKWNSKQNTLKVYYLDFLVHSTAHSDIQLHMAKIPEGLEILIQIMEVDNAPSSALALKILRNLCFHQSNRGRMLSENMLIPTLSNKLAHSTDFQEIENATVCLWALIANYEKGKLYAKKAYCADSISAAMDRIRKVEQTSNTESENVFRLLELLETVQKLIGGSNTGKLQLNSRSSSVSHSQQL